MTSGEFTSFPVDKIWVDRDKRQRKSLEGIEELAESIKNIGLINPLTIQKDGQLRTGERRWNAVKMLGWTSVAVQFIEDLPEFELQLVELEENIKRVNLSWQEECDAISAYHKLRSVDPEWTQEKTADALGMLQREVGEKLAVQKHIDEGDAMIAKADKYSVARNVVRRKQERAVTSVLAGLEGKDTSAPFLNVDFNLWVPAYAGPLFNMLHCDFPYGINFSDSPRQNSDTASLGEEYSDDISVYMLLLDTLTKAMVNVVAESAHMIFWFSMRHYTMTYLRLGQMGWKVDPFPLVWHKSDNAGVLPDPQRGPRRTYETAFFCSRGDRKIVQAVANSVSAPTTKDIHMSEKPIEVLRHFMRMTTDGFSNVLDPTAGSGNAIQVARTLRAASALGLEIDPQFYNAAKGAYNAGL
jgi:ParB/RepB/Spo0J family partition protein